MLFVFLAKAIAVLILAMGIVFFLSPDSARRLMEFWKSGGRIYLAGWLRVIFAAILLLAASQCRISAGVTAFGIIFLAGGVLIFALGQKRSQEVIQWWQSKPKAALRMISLIVVAVGALLLYCI